MFRKVVMMCSVIALGMGIAAEASAGTTLKIGTLAPSNSPWAKAFKQWASEVSTDTNGELTLDFQWNGQAGDDVLMVQKIRSGQLDGAAVAGTGLAQTGVTDILIFQLPGLFANWQKLDVARDATRDEFFKLFEAKGFTVVNFGDVGATKTMTVGYEVHRPQDLQGKGVPVLLGDPAQPKIYQAIGGITPKPMGVIELLPALTSGAIDYLPSPPLVAEQFQWASRLTHICTDTDSFIIGATIFSSSRLQALPPKLRDSLLARGRENQDKLNQTIRNLDSQAFARLKSSKITYSRTEAEKNEWKDMLVRVGRQLRGTVFTPAMFDKIVQLSGNTALLKD
jgi:TRAP-type C4-dicarboxylate transport system substrate-binding protein